MLGIEIENLKSNKYKAIINYAFLNCNYVSFVIDKESERQNDFFELLMQSCSQDILEEEMVYMHPETGTDFSGGHMVKLRCNSYIKSWFLKANCIEDFNGVDFPEDLCFFRDKKIWFKLVSHEKLLFIIDENSDDIDFLKLNKISYYHTI